MASEGSKYVVAVNPDGEKNEHIVHTQSRIDRPAMNA
jgi:hypothetical protein